jgi:hypothetical protein
MGLGAFTNSADDAIKLSLQQAADFNAALFVRFLYHRRLKGSANGKVFFPYPQRPGRDV